MIALKVTDADVDAERSYTLADYYRSHQQETDMVAAVENAASRAPSSRWAASALFLAGNFYWVQLDRDRASAFYKRVAEQFPNSADAVNAQWRVAWTAVLKRAPEAAEAVAGASPPLSGLDVHARCALLARPPGRGSRRAGTRAQLLRQVDRALPAKLFRDSGL